MVNQGALTVITKIQPGKMDNLQRLLGTIGKNVEHNHLIPFKKLTHIHFARFVVLDEGTDLNGQIIQPSLIFSTDYDAPLDGYLTELVAVAAEGLDQVYSHCEGYPVPDGRTRASRLAYLRAHMVESDAFYANTVGRSVQQIRQEAQLREAIEAFLDREKVEQAGAGQDPMRVRAAIQDFVNGESELSWAKTPPPPELAWRLKQILKLAGVGLGLLFLLPLIVPLLLVWAVLLRVHEEKDVPEKIKPNNERIGQLRANEDAQVQNQFSAVGYIKPGWFRHMTVHTILGVANFVARYILNRGNLAGVKTIHFARWVTIDQGRRVLFMSNYDGSLESYMDDFIDKVAWGLNAVFSNGVGYPKTRWLIQGGAQDEQAFKAFLRNRQILTPVWYAAYDWLTTLNINNNSKIRQGLYGPMNRQAAEAWLRRF